MPPVGIGQPAITVPGWAVNLLLVAAVIALIASPLWVPPVFVFTRLRDLREELRR